MDFLQGFPAACFQFGASLIFGVWPGAPAVSGEQCGSSQAASGAPGLWSAAPGTGKLQMKGIVHFLGGGCQTSCYAWHFFGVGTRFQETLW